MDIKINKRQWFLIIADTFLLAFSFYIALLLRFDFEIPTEYIIRFKQLIAGMVSICLIVFYALGLYRRLWRYASIGELNSLVFAVSLSTATVFFYTSFLHTPFPRTVYVINWALNIGLIGGIRFFIRILAMHLNSHHAKEPSTRVLIIGAGEAGAIVASEMKKHTNSCALPVGFIDDDPAKQRCSLHSIKVLGKSSDIPDIVAKHKVDEVIISIPSAPRSEIRRLTRICSSLPVKVKILPGVYELINGKVSVSQIRPVQIEDLLGREEVKTDLNGAAAYLKDEVILVTGAGGSIGSELCRQISSFNPKKLLLLDHTENNVYDIEMELKKSYPNSEFIPIVADVRHTDHINNIFSTYKPTVIFHAAAHKHVPLMECNREEAIQNNIFGTKNVAEAADRHHSKSFLLISTDKAVNPVSIMGATKRAAEIVIQTLSRKSKTRYCAVRFGNVLGSRGSVIPLFKKQISEGGPVTVTHPEMTRYFMTIRESVQLIIQAGAMGQNGEIFVLDMGEPVKILDLAQDLIKLSGLEPHKDIKITYNGIRPGEKLYEEVLTAEEGTKATKHERIYIAKATAIDRHTISHELDQLGQLLSHDLNLYQNIPIRSLS
jgi:FlaA1/EpsC-like NDP-sugar epimerase